MNGVSVLLRLQPITSEIVSVRNLLRPRRNIPFCGIYRKDGDTAHKNDLLACQLQMNYHPGLNVQLKRDRGQLLLKSMVDGKVMITQELINPDFSIPEMMAYKDRGDHIHKLTFNVVPFEMSRMFRLRNEI